MLYKKHICKPLSNPKEFISDRSTFIYYPWPLRNKVHFPNLAWKALCGLGHMQHTAFLCFPRKLPVCFWCLCLITACPLDHCFYLKTHLKCHPPREPSLIHLISAGLSECLFFDPLPVPATIKALTFWFNLWEHFINLSLSHGYLQYLCLIRWGHLFKS